MNPSPVGISLIQSFEQCWKLREDGSYEAYMPTPNDKPTIGWGTTGPDVHMGLVWTKSQCDARFASDLSRFVAGVTNAVSGARTTQNQFDAMVSFAYNVGMANFSSSTLLRLHKAEDYVGAADQFSKWVYQDKVVLPGLVRRRAAERALYLSEPPAS